MGKIKEIQRLVRNGLYYLTEHADEEAQADGFDIYDVEYGILSGKVRRTWPKENKYEMVNKKNIAGFWDGEQCEYCQGTIVEKKDSLPDTFI